MVNRKKISTLGMLVFMMSVGVFLYPSKHAFANYDGGLVVDDATFLNSSTMNEEAIQNFLISKNSGLASKSFYFDCASTGMSDQYYKSAGAPCNQNVRAATILYYASQIYGINPQVVLATLQKEQSLITSPTPSSWQINQAMGYGCPTTGTCNGDSGFLYQIDNGVWLLRYHMERARGNMDYWWHSTSWVCGTEKNFYKPSLYPKQNVNFYDEDNVYYRTHYIDSAATSSMYCYTPHAYNNPQGLYGLPPYGTTGRYYSGSYNFVLWFERWFGSTISGVKLSPLYKSSDTQQIFAVYGNTKYPFSSPEVMSSYGLNHSSVMTVTSAYLDSKYTTGPTISASLAKKMYDPNGTIYFFDNGKRYPLTIQSCKSDLTGAPIANTTWGLDCFNVDSTLTLPNELIDDFTVEDIPLSPLVINNGSVWLMELGKKRRITSPEVVNQYGGWAKAKWMQDYHVQQPEGKLLILSGSVVKFSGNDAIYLTDNNTLLLVQGMDQYSAWRLGERTSYNLPASYNTADPLPVNAALGFCATDQTTSTSYLLRIDGKKSPLPRENNYWPFVSSECLPVPSSFIANIPTSQMTTIYRAPNGNIFTTGFGVKYIFATPDDFKQLGNDPSQIMAVSNAVDNGLSYGGLNLAEGRLFKVINNAQIRLIRNGSSLAVNSSNYPGLPYSQLINVDESTGIRYPVTGTYQP